MAVVRLSNVSKRFGATVALDRVSLDLRRGEVHALVGENGAGKSTLMNILAGAVEPDSGEMSIGDEPFSPKNPLDARTRGVALIHQELSLCPHLTVAENILLGMEPARGGWLDRGAARRRTLEVLEDFHHPEIRPERRVEELSIAARQVVEICRAIAARAGILLMDEPTSSLQRDDVKNLFELIRRLQQGGISVIYISHVLEEVREIANRLTILRDGRSVSTDDLKSTSDRTIVSQMVGRPIESLYPRRERPVAGNVVFEVHDLVADGVKHVSLSLHRGEILGIAGLMGAGRTDLVRTLFGLQPAASGTISVNAAEIGTRRISPLRQIKRGIGYLSEDRGGEGLALSLSVADNITLTRFSTCSRWGWLDIAKQRRESEEWIDSVSIKTSDAYQPTRSLSGGNQQKVALARLLHQDAEILLLDEPTRGIDIGSKAQIYEIMARCVGAQKSILLVSSYLPELFGMCDRLAVMCRGRLSEARPINEWTPESVMQAAIGSQVAAA